MESKINKKIEELMEYNKKHNTQLSYGQFVALEQIEMQQKQKSGVEAAKTYLSRYKSLAEDDRHSKYGYQLMNDINKKIELVYNVDLIDVLYYLYVKCFDCSKTAEIIGVSVSTKKGSFKLPFVVSLNSFFCGLCRYIFLKIFCNLYSAYFPQLANLCRF